MDAYIEELTNNAAGYNINTRTIQEVGKADGYRMAHALYQFLGIDSNVSLAVGWSPDSVPAILQDKFGDNKLDYVFIDGGHSHDQIRADTNVLLPYLADNCIVFYHDFDCVSHDVREKMIANGFQLKEYHTGFRLAAYFRGFNAT